MGFLKGLLGFLELAQSTISVYIVHHAITKHLSYIPGSNIKFVASKNFEHPKTARVFTENRSPSVAPLSRRPGSAPGRHSDGVDPGRGRPMDQALAGQRVQWDPIPAA